MTPQAPWYIAVAVKGLAANVAAASKAWSKSDLCAWAPSLAASKSNIVRAIAHLRKLGLIRLAGIEERAGLPLVRGHDYYVITAEGVAAAKSARARQAAKTNSRFAGRLWSLLRAQRTLTANEAAEVLVDAGNQQEYDRACQLARRWLLAWSRTHPDTVQVSRQRVGRCTRYVLVRDTGTTPPDCDLQHRKKAAA